MELSENLVELILKILLPASTGGDRATLLDPFSGVVQFINAKDISQIFILFIRERLDEAKDFRAKRKVLCYFQSLQKGNSTFFHQVLLKAIWPRIWFDAEKKDHPYSQVITALNLIQEAIDNKESKITITTQSYRCSQILKHFLGNISNISFSYYLSKQVTNHKRMVGYRECYVIYRHNHFKITISHDDG